MGVVVILFTTMGGIKAVTYADVQQMMMIMGALILAVLIAIWKLPHDVSFLDAIRIAGAAGRLNAVDTHFDPNGRYNLWSGLIGSTFLMLAYFGTDQSQVQRYLTGKSIGQSRLGLLLNAMAKVPVQFFILERPPLLFQPVEMKRLEQTAEYPALQARYQQALDERQSAARNVKDGGSGDDFRA